MADSKRSYGWVAALVWMAAACGSNSGDTAGATGTTGSTGETTSSTTSSEPTSSDSGSSVSDSASGSTSTSSTTMESTTQSVEPTTGTSSTGPEPSTGTSTSTGTDSDTGTGTDSDSDSDSDTGTSTDTSTGTDTGTSTDTTGDTSSSSSDTNGCVPTEDKEVSCDKIDNDCDGNVDNVDLGGDGICDCLSIGILGNTGFAPASNFKAWLESKGTSVVRTLLANNPGVVTPEFLAQYDLVLIDRIERALSAEEAAALESFVKDHGRGLITLIGYNFDNGNPAPERDRANSALSPFGLAYQGPYFGNFVIPNFNQNHPISQGISDVNFAGGIEPVDTGNQGESVIFATVEGKNAGLAHQTALGGRIVVWGDEWITFDSDWQGYADVEDFWVNMVDWARPQDFCGPPQ